MSLKNLLNSISEEQPELLSKIAMAIKMTDAIDPDFTADTLEKFEKISAYTTEKVAAGWVDWARGVGAVGASALAGSIASDLYDVAKRGLTSGANFKRIMDGNEQLASYAKKDVKKAFDTLHRYAPEFTADPSVGGQLLHRMLEVPHDQANIVKDFISSRKLLREARKAQFSMQSVGYEAPKDVAGDFARAKALGTHNAEEGARVRSEATTGDLARAKSLETHKVEEGARVRSEAMDRKMAILKEQESRIQRAARLLSSTHI